MNTPTYKEQFDKLTRAYINNEVYPFDQCACFIGNLLNNNRKWANSRDYKNEQGRCEPIGFNNLLAVREVLNKEACGFYKPIDIHKIEKLFLSVYFKNGGIRDMHIDTYDNVINEDALFIAFEKTLDLLKQIHISKGENVDEEFVFVKRSIAV